MDKKVWVVVEKFIWVATLLLWITCALAIPTFIALYILKVKGIVLISWEQLLTFVAYLVILDPILLLIDQTRYDLNKYYMENGEDVER